MSPNKVHHTDYILNSVSDSKASCQRKPPVDPMILRSWQRCVNDYDLMPSTKRTARVFTSTELKDFKLPIEKFLHVARSGLTDLHTQVRDLDYVILLTDANGITVDYIGNGRDDKEFHEASLYLGADWNEQRAATNGVGICSTEMQPVTVHQADHFDLRNTTLTCTAAPIFGPDGNPLAVLDVSSLRSPRNKASQHLLLELVKLHAKNIESANFLEHFQDDYWIIQIGPLREYIEINGHNMIAVDEGGVIAGLTPSARRYLFNSSTYLDKTWSTKIGTNISSIFDCSMDEILNRTRHTAKNLAPVSLKHKKEHFFLSVKPPRKARHIISPQHKSSSSNKKDPLIRPGLTLDQLVGGDETLKHSIDFAKRILNNKINFLIEGETGTGKEVFARAIHEESNRSSKPFVAVNCAAIPESLIESELFGYAPGSFTGAKNNGMQGLIQQSNAGTLFLDEIGDMPLNLQTRLLRVLSEHELMPLGTKKAINLDLNVIAATHKDIECMISEGVFREDLYFRIAGTTLTLPALRERTDMKHVIESVLSLESKSQDITISQETINLLMSYWWPGNIRELRNILRIACAICNNNKITPDHFPRAFLNKANGPHTTDESPPKIKCNSGTLDESNQADALIVALKRNKWNITDAATDLGLSRATIYRQMKKHRIVSPNERDSSVDMN